MADHEATRKDWVDYLRVVALFGVLIMHVSSLYYNEYGKIGQADWWLANILNRSHSSELAPGFP